MRLKTRDTFNVALFSALTAVGAFIVIPLPFSLVPVTLQTLFTYMAGGLLGGYLGALSQLIYILIGVSGLPVFASGNAGPSVLLGPTGGYLVGFVAGAFIIGKMAEAKERSSFLWLLTCMIVGTIIIYTSGIVQLMNWMKIGLSEAVFTGVAPFIVGDALKIILAAYLINRIREMLPDLAHTPKLWRTQDCLSQQKS